MIDHDSNIIISRALNLTEVTFVGWVDRPRIMIDFALIGIPLKRHGWNRIKKIRLNLLIIYYYVIN